MSHHVPQHLLYSNETKISYQCIARGPTGLNGSDVVRAPPIDLAAYGRRITASKVRDELPDVYRVVVAQCRLCVANASACTHLVQLDAPETRHHHVTVRKAPSSMCGRAARKVAAFAENAPSRNQKWRGLVFLQ